MAGDLPYAVMRDHAMYVTVDVEIHSRACRPPAMMIVLRLEEGGEVLVGCTPTRRAGMDRPS